jgi:outer membrane protein OmpA-like peptidoglycan-associated protein
MRLALARSLLVLSALFAHVQTGTALSPPPRFFLFFPTGSTSLEGLQKDATMKQFVQAFMINQDEEKHPICAWVLAYTDTAEARSYGAALSPMRGEAIKKRLIELGVPKDHISVAAYADSVPMLDNAPDDEPQNRRAEIVMDKACNFDPGDIRR